MIPGKKHNAAEAMRSPFSEKSPVTEMTGLRGKLN
jgi:hypothetical protein